MWGMEPTAFIEAKRDGLEHTKPALQEFFGAFLKGQIPDYQVSAWLMAVYFQGMSPAETLALTRVMAESGHMLDLSGFAHTVDKHSSGGVGDKTTLVVAPILAAAGCTVAKISGRGLTYTGGTIDKLESIPGWHGEFSEAEFLAQTRRVGLVVAAQSGELAPLDGRLYALRDVTATVNSIPLIASSIMSKKLASGAKTIVLDVKVGAGAFMKTLEGARELAKTMIAIGLGAGRNMRVVLSSMERPLGKAVGHALEVKEAIETLSGSGPQDLKELALTLAGEGLEATGLAKSQARDVLESGRALSKFRQFVEAQGGDPKVVDNPGLLELAPEVFELKAETAGYVTALNALNVGQAVLLLGGGRQVKGEAIDLGVGVMLEKKPGDKVSLGETLVRVYHRGKGLEAALASLKSAYQTGTEPPATPLVLEVMRG